MSLALLAARLADIDWMQVGTAFVALLLSLSFHESAHAWTAWRLGDPTGKLLGRITMNPVPHIDPFGTFLLPLLQLGTTGTIYFAYAKPVPYNPYQLKNPQAGSAAIAAAGPVSNLLLSLVAAVGLGLALRASGTPTLGHEFLTTLMVVNIGLAIFNLLPVPPLDGWTVLAGFLPRRAAAGFARVEVLGLLPILVLMWTGLLDRIMGPPMGFLLERLLLLVQSIRG